MFLWILLGCLCVLVGFVVLKSGFAGFCGSGSFGMADEDYRWFFGDGFMFYKLLCVVA